MDFAFTGSMKKKTGPTKKWTSQQVKELIAKFDTKVADAKTREGDSEVRDAVLEKAQFLRMRLKTIHWLRQCLGKHTHCPVAHHVKLRFCFKS